MSSCNYIFQTFVRSFIFLIVSLYFILLVGCLIKWNTKKRVRKMQIKHQLFILSATLLTCFLSILVICVLVLSTKIDNSFDDDSNNQPICAKGTLFDRKTMQKCQLQHYTTEDVANCFNELYSQPQRRYKPVHIAFVGDSIIRNQFINFIRVFSILIYA